jgi:spore germination cell wall hydrolase CwlJ-like protein
MNATHDEIWALCVWREARGCSKDAKLAVAYVIRNRAADPKNRWPKDEKRVCLEPWQFSSFNPDDPNFKKYPEEGSEVWKDCLTAVAQVKSNVPDPSLGATHYHSYPEGHPKWPKWAKAEKLTVRIGPFWFYRY